LYSYGFYDCLCLFHTTSSFFICKLIMLPHDCSPQQNLPLVCPQGSALFPNSAELPGWEGHPLCLDSAQVDWREEGGLMKVCYISLFLILILTVKGGNYTYLIWNRLGAFGPHGLGRYLQDFFFTKLFSACQYREEEMSAGFYPRKFC
jgi:hypothetical protein